MLEYIPILLFLCISSGLSTLIYGLSFVFGTRPKEDVEKVSAYECGFDPFGDARSQFDIRFYLVSILFIIFDLEAVFFYPWCVSFSFLNIEGFWGMIDFIVELLVGFIYAWEVGALEWE